MSEATVIDTVPKKPCPVEMIPQAYLIQTLVSFCKTLHTRGELEHLRIMDNFLRECDQAITPETFGDWNTKAYELINKIYDAQAEKRELMPDEYKKLYEEHGWSTTPSRGE